LLASGPDGEMLWLDVTHRPGQAPWVRLMGRYLLPPCKQRWHTCAAFLPQGGLLVCGDRRGSLLLFPCSSSPGWAVESAGIADGGTSPVSEDTGSGSEPSCLSHKGALPLEAPLSVLFGLHGKMGVTSVTCHEGYIYSTGRDGSFHQLRLQGQQLEVLRKHRPCKGLQWIEELRFTPDGDLLVLGFHADNFVVWSSRTGENLHCIPCGGGHRSWSYCSNASAEAFAFVKCGDVMLYHREAEPCEQRVLLESLHGREIACVRRLGAVEVPGHTTLNIFVTGSEDTTACVLALSERSRAAMPLTRLSDHISSVRALALASPESLSAPCSGGRLPPAPAADCPLLQCRVFGLLEAARKLVLVAESFHHQRCVLKVEAFLHTWAGGERRHLLCSAATDGSIAFWDITSPITDATDALHRAEGEIQPLG
ncbi:WD repeat-containing protein 6, partial [Pygoscelis adeliae]